MTSSPEQIEVVLNLNRGSDSIRGWFDDGSGARCPFSGWLELSALLERARLSAAPAVPGDPASTSA